MEIFTLNTSAISFTDEEFFMFCQDNDTLRFERSADQQIIVMAPTGLDTSFKNSDLNYELVSWNRRTKLGYVFDSNAGFTLPNNAVRSPDAAWVKKERYEALDLFERQRFSHICPDFVIELQSLSDTIKHLQEKMVEYIDNGCQLGWLISPDLKKVFIYKPGSKIIESPFDSPLSGENVLPGFLLDLSKIF
ncbi:MAG: Uma2 family endonuclease [Opitutaceae bacterium]|nr:Uma2 family endonuclease [Cytophagales bacterium]